MGGLFAGTSLERPVTCEVCEKPLSACRCPRDRVGRVLLPKDQAVRVQRERRRGKWTTVVLQLDPAANDLAGMCAAFRKEFSTGGTVKDGAIELQGDHRDAVVAKLKGMGYAAKAAGG